jgi:elongation factor G
LRVLDGAVAVFDGKEGVEPQSETVWRQADKYNVPRICFVNKMDKLGADFFFTVKTIVERLGARPVVMQLPIGAENTFRGVVDLLEMRALTWAGEVQKGEDYKVEAIPEDLQEQAEEYRAALMETVAEASEELLEKFLETGELSNEEIKEGVRLMTVAGDIFPVFCGSAFKNKGVQPMLDAVIDYLPSPLEVPPMVGFDPKDETKEITRQASAKEPFAALAFKVVVHPFYGKLTYVRVYSGEVAQGAQVINSTKSRKERIGKLFQMHSNKENPVPAITAGNIYAVVGLKDTTTGDTLCDPAHPVILESMTFPEPVIQVSIEPNSRSDQEKLSIAIQKLAEEDPTFRVSLNEDTGQTIVAGMGELHLDVLVDRMRREHKVVANIGKPQVAYRETIRRKVEKVDYTHKKQTGGSGQYAKVQVTFEPLPLEGEAVFEFVNKVVGGRVPREYIPSVEAGIQDAMSSGPLAGYPVVGVKATLLDGQSHDVDSSELAFKVAGSMVFREGAKRADPALLEPIMDVEVRTPEQYMGDVIGDLTSRRGQIQSMEDASGVKVVRARVPLSAMFGYVGDLRSKTQGRAVCTMQFDSYAEVPRSVAEEIIKKTRGE